MPSIFILYDVIAHSHRLPPMKKRTRKSTRPPVKRKLAGFCPCCSHANPWVENAVIQEHQWRGVLHSIQTKVMECKHCPATTTTAEQDKQTLQLIRACGNSLK